MAYIKKVNIATKCLNEHKAEGISVLNVKNLNPFADYYVVATAGNIRHLGALADQLEEAYIKEGEQIRKIDGKPESGWVIVDANEVVVHLFTQEKRDEILLEHLIEVVNRDR